MTDEELALQYRADLLATIQPELLDNARAGDPHAAYVAGERLVGCFDADLHREAVDFLRCAFDGGIREAGYILAGLSPFRASPPSGLPPEQRVELLEEQALTGEPFAALTLIHELDSLLVPARRLAILQATAENSAELAEFLEEVTPGNGAWPDDAAETT